MTPSPEALAESVERLTFLAKALIDQSARMCVIEDPLTVAADLRLVLNHLAALTDPAMVLVPRELLITEDASDLIHACADQFREYERQHRAKGTPEADAKAEVNAAFARRCLAMLGARSARASVAP